MQFLLVEVCSVIPLQATYYRDMILTLILLLASQISSPWGYFNTNLHLEDASVELNLLHWFEMVQIHCKEKFVGTALLQYQPLRGGGGGRGGLNLNQMGMCHRLLRRPVKLIQRVKIAHSFLQSVSNLFHFIILSLPMSFCIRLSKNFLELTSKTGEIDRFNHESHF